jgi:hypothetical protein
MKKHLLLVSALFLGLVLNLQAQAPQAIQYQTIIRNASGEVVMNQSVGLQLTVRQTTATGTAAYQETHTKMTNDYGLVNLQIGTGSVTSGTFSGIDWSDGPYHLEVGLDLANGTNYTVMGTTQLLSVPYALYAERAGNPGLPGPKGDKGDQGDQGQSGQQGPPGADGTQLPAGGAAGQVLSTDGSANYSWVDNGGDQPLLMP